MSSVFSIDSEGIWNACTANVITKTAITTVASKDWIDATQSSRGARVRGCGGVTSATFSGATLVSVMLASLFGTDTSFRCLSDGRGVGQVFQDLARGFLLGPLFRRSS